MLASAQTKNSTQLALARTLSTLFDSFSPLTSTSAFSYEKKRIMSE